MTSITALDDGFQLGKQTNMWEKRVNVAVIVLTCLLVATILFPMIQQAREAALRTQSKNKLKQIGLALLNYESNNLGLPPGGVFNLEGRGFHGWMTSILPFVDSSPFYNYVNFNEPWDSTQNAGLFLNSNSNYENAGEPISHRYWEFPVAHFSANSHIMAVNSFVKLKSIVNRERVFLIGELVGDFLPWGCPHNWRELNGLNSTPATYGRSTRDGCHFLFCDGRVEFVSNEVSNDIVKRMSGDDLAGFKENSLNVQCPSAFPCPADALWHTWSYGAGAGRVEIKRDIHGIVKSKETIQGK